MHITKLCSDIQHNAESSIIQIIEKHLSKQNKHKKAKKAKTTTKNPIISNQGFKPQNTLPLHLLMLLQRLTPPLPHNTTHQPSKPQPHSVPIQHSKPQALNIPYQSPKTTLPHIPNPNIHHYTNQTPIIHRNKNTDLHHQIIITHLNTVHPHPHLHPYSHPKLQPIYHTTYQTNKLTKLLQIPHTNLHLPQPPKLPILTNNANPHLSTPHNYHNTLPTTHVTNTTKISTHYSADLTKPTP